MKTKHLAIIYLLILTIGTIVSIYMPKAEMVGAEDTKVIPDEAIRLRILANSDAEEDQAVKRLIRDQVNEDITKWVAELTSLDEARDVITSHLPDIQATAEAVIKEQGLEQSVKVDFGQAEFPTKLYGQYLYPAGEYEAVIITLGEGDGANWWCVLFPPLCFLDFSNGTAVSQSPIVEDEGEGSLTSEGKAYAATNEESEPVAEEVVEEEGLAEKEKGPEEVVEEEVIVESVKEEAPEVTVKEEVVEPEVKEEVAVVKDKEQVTEEVIEGKVEENKVELAASNEKGQQLYEGEKEPEVEVKSLFAEIFNNLF
ncbi:stage II sporulation protein R [Peribacillus castrilensis]|uniref:stage II sporulation protein R n=1 Tax=Bacillaceae TaxID=186817 RepID=UPI00080A8351|nr:MULTISPECIES: stage II sporulation protein R [Bacillaceae]MCP1092818.1 stage II sporulation protein R [Bacillaceae bacterium OS4b]MBD8587071.1 stage II sporulation protein R [Peribacillus simplex]MCF7625244.1 stage II sporulation protein R [Peribacillus frigoritolerans]MCP1155779.1 stage II sporulation protein R [Peribacillus frigoritolerans]MCT1387745.1 stage II sporulation protein R [Peribacillus frigoritolerans]